MLRSASVLISINDAISYRNSSVTNLDGYQALSVRESRFPHSLLAHHTSQLQLWGCNGLANSKHRYGSSFFLNEQTHLPGQC